MKERSFNYVFSILSGVTSVKPEGNFWPDNASVNYILSIVAGQSYAVIIIAITYTQS